MRLTHPFYSIIYNCKKKGNKKIIITHRKGIHTQKKRNIKNSLSFISTIVTIVNPQMYPKYCQLSLFILSAK